MGAPNDFDGAVLCGGRSSRMGADKALVEIDGVPMAVRVAEALRGAGAHTVAAVGGDVMALRAAGLTAHADRRPGEGPLGGLVSSLDSVGSLPTVVVLSCDLLRPDPEVIAALVRHRVMTGADVVVPVAGGRRQWTHGAWRREAVRVLTAAFDGGERSLFGAAASLHVEEWAVADPSRLADADRPSDLPSGRGHP